MWYLASSVISNIDFVGIFSFIHLLTAVIFGCVALSQCINDPSTAHSIRLAISISKFSNGVNRFFTLHYIIIGRISLSAHFYSVSAYTLFSSFESLDELNELFTPFRIATQKRFSCKQIHFLFISFFPFGHFIQTMENKQTSEENIKIDCRKHIRTYMLYTEGREKHGRKGRRRIYVYH